MISYFQLQKKKYISYSIHQYNAYLSDNLGFFTDILNYGKIFVLKNSLKQKFPKVQ
jgi:hypothetical protein